jgi:DNA polymerase-3 subunit gamma/tau
VVVQPQKVEPPKPKLKPPVLKSAQRRTSSLSLKSIHEKKVVKKVAEEENFDNHPKDAFTEAILQQLWKDYVALLITKGERSMASIVGTDLPKLGQEFKITFTVPNKLMEDQFRKGRPKLINFLREKLNNYGIKIIVVLNETVEKKFAYTPQEKYNKMKEINPLLGKLRNVFELDM